MDILNNVSAEILEANIARYTDRINNFRPDPSQSGHDNARELSKLKMWLQQNKDALNRRRNAVAADLSTDSLMIDEQTLSSPYRGLTTPTAEHHERLVLERPLVWLSRTLHKPLSEVSNTLTHPETITPLWEALASRLSLVGRPSTTPTLVTAFHANLEDALATISRQLGAYTHGPFGHRITVLLDFDPTTGNSTPYMVLAPTPAIEYLAYKLPVNLRTLPSDPVWHLLSHLLRGPVDIWPLTQRAYQFPLIGERRATNTTVVQTTSAALQAVQRTIQVPFAIPAIEERLISYHAPAWEYQIPTPLPNDPALINALARHNQERVRFSRERRDKRGPISGSRIQVGMQPKPNRIPGDPVKTEPVFVTVPTDELIPTQLVTPQGQPLPISDLCPGIETARHKHPKAKHQIDLKHQVYEEMFL